MKTTQPPDDASRREGRGLRFSLRSVLVAILLLSLLLAGWRISGGAAGALELVLLAVAAVSLMTGASLGWPWNLGIVVCLIVAVFYTPPDPITTLIVAIPLCLGYTIGVITWNTRRTNAR
jgi:Sec-independent protein secretion pathway component TatC